MSTPATRVGVRLLELESGFASNVEGSSPELVDYEATRTVGRAARVAMLIRGQDVIDDERKLRKILAAELGIVSAYDAVKRTLLEADLIDERVAGGKTVLYEKVERVLHEQNYQRLGEVWTSRRDRTAKEVALIDTLDRVVQVPCALSRLDALLALDMNERSAVVELAGNAGVLDRLGDTAEDPFFSPLLWDVNPKKLKKLLRACSHDNVRRVLEQVQGKGGVDTTSSSDAVLQQAISAGVLPSYRVRADGGDRSYTFAPYLGDLLTSDHEKTILDKARALVACLRYGGEAATVSRIRNPLWIINALLDENRKHRIGPHSELKNQYGMLVKKALGRVIQARDGSYFFELIPTKDNKRACAIASEILSSGEVLAGKDNSINGLLALVSGEVDHPLKGVNVAKKKRPARADELADLVEELQRV